MLKSVGASKQPCFTCDWEGFYEFSIIQHFSLHTIMELMHQWDEFLRTTKLCHDFPPSFITWSTKCLGEVNKCCVQIMVLFLTLPLSLHAANIILTVPHPSLKLHWLSGRISCCSCYMRWLRGTCTNIFPLLMRRDIASGSHITVSFSVVEVNDGDILILLMNDFTVPHYLKEFVKFLKKEGPPVW